MIANQSSLANALQRLEQAVGGNASSGKVTDDVAREAARCLEQLATVYREETIPQHAKDFARIRKEDIALQPRILQLQEEDEAILESLDETLACTKSLVDASGDSERPDGAQYEACVDETRALVNRMRGQQENIRKWFSEAFLRDRGFPSS